MQSQGLSGHAIELLVPQGYTLHYKTVHPTEMDEDDQFNKSRAEVNTCGIVLDFIYFKNKVITDTFKPRTPISAIKISPYLALFKRYDKGDPKEFKTFNHKHEWN